MASDGPSPAALVVFLLCAGIDAQGSTTDSHPATPLARVAFDLGEDGPIRYLPRAPCRARGRVRAEAGTELADPGWWVLDPDPGEPAVASLRFHLTYATLGRAPSREAEVGGDVLIAFPRTRPADDSPRFVTRDVPLHALACAPLPWPHPRALRRDAVARPSPGRAVEAGSPARSAAAEEASLSVAADDAWPGESDGSACGADGIRVSFVLSSDHSRDPSACGTLARLARAGLGGRAFRASTTPFRFGPTAADDLELLGSRFCLVSCSLDFGVPEAERLYARPLVVEVGTGR